MKRFKNILFVVEPYSQNNASLERATALAESNQADLTIVDIVPEITAGIGLPPGGPISLELQDSMQREYRERLKTMLAPYASRPNIKTDVLTGTAFLEIIRAVLREGYDLVMKPVEDPSWLERIFGSDDMHLLRKCPCPVWLHKPGENVQYKSVLAAVELPDSGEDDADLQQFIVQLASSLAIADFSELHVVHACEIADSGLFGRWAASLNKTEQDYARELRDHREQAFFRIRDQLKDILGDKTFDHLAPQFYFLMGSAEEVIPVLAKKLQTDVVVMGTLKRAGIAGLFISNAAEAIIEQLRCSILAVKPAGFKSPVKLI